MGEVVFALLQENHRLKDKAFRWSHLGLGVYGSDLTNVWEKTSFARLKSCASGCCKRLCSVPLFFRHIMSYSVAHMPPFWVTGTRQLAELYDALGEGNWRLSEVAFCSVTVWEAYCKKHLLIGPTELFTSGNTLLSSFLVPKASVDISCLPVPVNVWFRLGQLVSLSQGWSCGYNMGQWI